MHTYMQACFQGWQPCRRVQTQCLVGSRATNSEEREALHVSRYTCFCEYVYVIYVCDVCMYEEKPSMFLDTHASVSMLV
jgi:hypothetical protein